MSTATAPAPSLIERIKALFGIEPEPEPEKVPLIWTKHGNMPIAYLRYEHEWVDHPEYIKFIERYYLGAELVKESAHVLKKKGLDLSAIQGGLK